MNWNIIFKILIAIVGLIVISTYLQPILLTLFPPLGLIILVVLYIGVVAWLFDLLPR